MGLAAFFKEHVADFGGDGDKPAVAQKPSSPRPAAPPLNWQQPTSGSTSTAPAPQAIGFDPEMVAQLQAVVLKRATPYTALVESSARLVGIIPDEATRFKAAYANISAGGARTTGSIAAAIDVHCSDLDNEGKRFEQTMSEQLNEQVVNVRQSAQAARARSDSQTARIESLRAQIVEAQNASQQAFSEAAELDAKAANAEAEINNVKQRFDQSVEAVKADLVAKRAYLSTVLV